MSPRTHCRENGSCQIAIGLNITYTELAYSSHHKLNFFFLTQITLQSYFTEHLPLHSLLQYCKINISSSLKKLILLCSYRPKLLYDLVPLFVTMHTPSPSQRPFSNFNGSQTDKQKNFGSFSFPWRKREIKFPHNIVYKNYFL